MTPAAPTVCVPGYFEVDRAAVRLAERATSGFPLSPIDSVGCHSMLKELRAGALGLEATVAALSDGAAGPAVVDRVPSSVVDPGMDVAGAAGPPAAAPSVEAPLTRDLYMRPPHRRREAATSSSACGASGVCDATGHWPATRVRAVVPEG